MNEIVNRVAESGLITIDPEDFRPEDVMTLDIKPWLFEEMILKEKLFREHLSGHDWTQYKGKHVNVTCTADAIIPTWAYMLAASKLSGIAASVSFGSREQLIEKLIVGKVNAMDVRPYEGQRIIVKGCSGDVISPSFYMALANRLQPVVKSLMYGEACSTVPVFKRKD